MSVEKPVKDLEKPWEAGLRAARANLLPGLILQLIMLALLLGYYFYPPTTELLNKLADLKARWGYGYSVVAAIIAGAVIPEIMRIVVFQKGKLLRTNLGNFLFAAVHWAWSGAVVDLLYRQQAIWWGAEVTFKVVAIKVIIDQFVFNPLFAGPVNSWAYDWKNSGYSCRNLGRFFTASYYRRVIVPTLLATWGVWIPVVTILYSLPPLLQIPLFALALSLWVMIYTWMSEQRNESA
ncbi:hypothetical protein N9868_00515 [Akkermansiaceae bacterium]|nr:hypothetical protein [Akkermansiaceae bacterium]MDB4287812.1 hypothetical protein [bacterium]MDB4267888.1 hypothetical protein [Akkermansiaceae bacterium]MDB4275957.1 hypothetical protein [Akkermansiaceae bacterium]MDB4286821.1 hypothetical protein [Akkermansiaceae bacterium]